MGPHTSPPAFPTLVIHPNSGLGSQRVLWWGCRGGIESSTDHKARTRLVRSACQGHNSTMIRHTTRVGGNWVGLTRCRDNGDVE